MNTGLDMRDHTGFVAVACQISDEIRNAYLEKTVSSSLTNMERSELGEAVIYTEWEDGDVVILRDYNWLDRKAGEQCEHLVPDAADGIHLWIKHGNWPSCLWCGIIRRSYESTLKLGPQPPCRGKVKVTLRVREVSGD